MDLRAFLTMRANEAFRGEVDCIFIRQDTDSVRDGWFEADCYQDGWHTSGSEPVCEEAASNHVAEQHAVGRLIVGLWAAVKVADERTLRALAAPFADHPDYSPAWTPLPAV